MTAAAARRPFLLPSPDARALSVVEVDGRSLWLFDDGGLLPYVAGGSPDDDPPAGGGAGSGGPAGGSGGDGAGRTFTQDDVTRIGTREKEQGERAGKRAALEPLAKALGIDVDAVKVEDLAGLIERARAAEDAQKTEAQRAKDAADAEKAAATTERQNAAQERHAAAVERVLLRSGVAAGEDDDEKVAKAVDRAARLLDVEVGADAETIRKAVDTLKTDVPALFAPAEPGAGGQQQPPPGDPGTPGRGAGAGSGKSGVAAGKAKAAELGWTKKTA